MKTQKRILFLIGILTIGLLPLRAAALKNDHNPPQHNLQVMDYTASHSKKPIDHTIDADDLEEQDLEDDLQTVVARSKDNHMLLTVMLSNKPFNQKPKKKEQKEEPQQEEGGTIIVTSKTPQQLNNEAVAIYKKYLLDATGLLNEKAHRTAHKYFYHIIQTQPSHIIPALLQWLHLSKEKHVITLAMNAPICPPCKYLLNVVVGYTKEVASNEQGCQGNKLEWQKMPPLAKKYLDRFVLQSGRPLDNTKIMLEKLAGISEKSHHELQQQIDQLKKELQASRQTIQQKDNTIGQLQNSIQEKDEAVQQKENTIGQLQNSIQQKDEAIQQKDNSIEQLQNSIQEKDETVQQKENTIGQLQNSIQQKDKAIQQKENTIEQLTQELQNEKQKVAQAKKNQEDADLLLAEELNKVTEQYAKDKKDWQQTIQELHTALQIAKQKESNNDNVKKEKHKNMQLKKNVTNEDFTGSDLSGQNLSQHICKKCNFTNANLTNVQLPKDLSASNLKGANFTGCKFTATDLTDTILDGATLTHTTCDYQAHFQDNMKANEIYGGEWYQDNLPNDLKSIAKVYPQLKKDADKVELLHIASGLARLPYDDQDPEFYIKVQYWSCKLWRLKNRLSKDLGDQLVCSLEDKLTYGLSYEAGEYCWQTKYPQDKITCTQAVNIPQGKPDFNGYLKQFRDGLKQYKVQSKNSYSFTWYKETIEKNIQGLAKAYPKVEDKSLQKEMLEMSYKLSKSYELQHADLLFHFLYHQNLLIRIGETVGVGAKNDIHYNQYVLFYLVGLE